MRYHGGFVNGAACDPTGAERLVDFPTDGFGDNYPAIASWIDHNQNPFVSTNELRPQGGTPIAASLRDMRTSILASLTADRATPCRKYQAIVLTDGGESCESVAAAVTAAGTFQNLAFTNPNGVAVSNYDVPVYVIGFAICPPGQPNCQTRTDLNSIAAAGGTGAAILVNNQLELQLALAQIVAASVVAERCNNLDDDCDNRVDEDFPGKGAACSAGVGTCYDDGTIVCTADQLGLTCNATPGAPSAEVCNGLDDNCNGLIDDGVSCSGCVPVCTDAAGCDICNNIDEDCDAIIDEDFVSTSCGAATGECAPGTTALHRRRAVVRRRGRPGRRDLQQPRRRLRRHHRRPEPELLPGGDRLQPRHRRVPGRVPARHPGVHRRQLRHLQRRGHPRDRDRVQPAR
jgi:hypothetical protein